MAISYQNPAKSARMTATMSHFADGTLELMSAANAVLVVFGLSAGGGSVSAAGAWTLAFDNTTVAATGGGTGTACTKAQLKTSAGVANLTGLTVGATGSGSDIQLNNVNIATGQNVTLSSAVITHAA